MDQPTTLQIECAGYSLAADWYEGRSDDALLTLIGFESNKAKYVDMIQAIINHTGTAAIVLDYSGHGDSPFALSDISPAQHFLEVIVAFDWLKINHPDKHLSVMGTSYGGFHATLLTQFRAFDQLILRVPAIYPEDVFYTKWKDMDVDYIRGTYRHETKDLEDHSMLRRAREFRGKTLVVTHELDDICPPNVTEAFVNAFQAASFMQPKFKHSVSQSNPDPEVLQAYYLKIAEFLK